MHLAPTDIRRLEEFLTRIQSEAYPEPPSQIHTDITNKVFDEYMGQLGLAPGAKILDVGCGSGLAMELFAARGYTPIGITINPTDLATCRAKGLDVREMDQSFLDFEDATFDLVWCRHCLEHSVMPLFTLTQLNRVLRPGGWLYVEVPAPDTSAGHQTNRNHYSVLPRSAWVELITRSGIADVQHFDIGLELHGLGPDSYFGFFGRKAS